MTSRQQVIDQLRAWVMAKNPKLTDVDLDSDLIQAGIIDSLAFVDFVLFLEDVAGREISVNQQAVGTIRTLRAVLDNYFQDAA